MAGCNRGRFGKNGRGRGNGLGCGNQSVNSGRGTQLYNQVYRSLMPKWDSPFQPETNQALSVTDDYGILQEKIKTTTSQLKAIQQHLNNNDPVRERNLARINEALCLNCLQCVNICPRGAIVMGNYYPQVQSDKCSGCGLCAAQCPAGAIEMI